MYYEIFIDVFFVTNLVMDYILLRITGRILGCSATHRRTLAAAAAGALALSLLIVTGLLSQKVLNTILMHVIINTFMVKFGCRIKCWAYLLRGLLLLYLASFLAGGLLLWMQRRLGVVGFWTFLVLAALCYVIITAGILIYTRLKRDSGRFYEVVLYAEGKCEKVKGLYDTGNRLFDTLSNKPVSIITEEAALRLLSQDELAALGPHYIPFQSVGCDQGVLLAVTLDALEVKNETMSRTVSRPVVALAKGRTAFGKGYQMILHPDLADG